MWNHQGAANASAFGLTGITQEQLQSLTPEQMQQLRQYQQRMYLYHQEQAQKQMQAAAEGGVMQQEAYQRAMQQRQYQAEKEAEASKDRKAQYDHFEKEGKELAESRAERIKKLADLQYLVQLSDSDMYLTYFRDALVRAALQNQEIREHLWKDGGEEWATMRCESYCSGRRQQTRSLSLVERMCRKIETKSAMDVAYRCNISQEEVDSLYVRVPGLREQVELKDVCVMRSSFNSEEQPIYQSAYH